MANILTQTHRFALLIPLKLTHMMPVTLRYLFEHYPLAVSANDWEKLLPWNMFTA